MKFLARKHCMTVWLPVLGSTLAMMSVPTFAASISLKQADVSGVVATIVPDAGDMNLPANIWIGAVYNGTLFMRGTAYSAWSQHGEGALPIAQQVGSMPSSLEVMVANFDVSNLSGLDIYVGYGSTEGDLAKNGHLAKIYTVPAMSGTASFAGSYTGSYSGDDSGSVALGVDSAGRITVSIPGPGTGTITNTGSASFASGGGALGTVSCSFTGTFLSSGSASGSWACTDSSDGSRTSGNWTAWR